MSSAESSKVESPTSILTYIQCPRKYYYRCVRRLEQKPCIHLVVGDVVHSTIAAFHNADISDVPVERLFEILHARMLHDLRSRWDEKKGELKSLGLDPKDEKAFYEDAGLMVDNFYQHHVSRVVAYQYRRNVSLGEAFERVRPKTETKIISTKYGLMGVIDAIHDIAKNNPATLPRILEARVWSNTVLLVRNTVFFPQK
jgi:PD-(D/E)XK nuclease superfamily